MIFWTTLPTKNIQEEKENHIIKILVVWTRGSVQTE